MAMNAETVLFVAVPHAGSLSVQACLPLTQDRAVTLAAKDVGFFKTYQLAVRKPQFVPVVGIVAIKAPAARHVMQRGSDFLMHVQFSGVSVDRHALMAL
jgi:hypothetical protein